MLVSNFHFILFVNLLCLAHTLYLAHLHLSQLITQVNIWKASHQVPLSSLAASCIPGVKGTQQTPQFQLNHGKAHKSDQALRAETNQFRKQAVRFVEYLKTHTGVHV